MSKRYELLIPASFAASALAGRPSKKSLAATCAPLLVVGWETRATVLDSRVNSVESRPVRLELREPRPDDVQGRLDPDLPAAAYPGHDGLRASAAEAARALRTAGGTVAWRATTPDEVRAVVEGTAYGAYDPGLLKAGYASRPEVTLALDAPDDLHELARRQEVVARHLDAARDLANRPPNDLTPEALAAHARSLARDGLTVEAHG